MSTSRAAVVVVFVLGEGKQLEIYVKTLFNFALTNIARAQTLLLSKQQQNTMLDMKAHEDKAKQ